jgi:formylglycine-generating enzyme required for sulfatase activity
MASTLPADELGSVPRIAFGQKRANAAVTMLKLGEKESVLPVFNWTDDPEALSQFIFRCKPRGIPVDALLDLLDLVSVDPMKYPKDTRYALLLSIGEYGRSEIPASRCETLIKKLADWYANDPSSGVHGAAGWLLRHLGEMEVAEGVDQQMELYSPDREWFTLAITVQPLKEKSVSETTKPKPPKKTFYYTFIVHPKGEFTIGSLDDQPDRSKDELRHTVILTRPFALLDREITFEELIAFAPQYAGYMKQEDAAPNDAGFGAHWYDSVAFCRWLGQEMGLAETDQCYADPETLDEKPYPRDPQSTSFPRDWPLDLSKRGFRLPTESEWEIAARSGSRTSYGFGSEVSLLDRFGWFTENGGKKVHPGREKRPSVRGMFDLHGNLFEWTHDWDGDFGDSRQTDPVGAKTGSGRVYRGGSWFGVAALCRSANRFRYSPVVRNYGLGFRLALSPSGIPQSPEADK